MTRFESSALPFPRQTSRHNCHEHPEPLAHHLIPSLKCRGASSHLFVPIDKGEEVIRPLKAFGPPLQDMLGPMPYAAQQCLTDAALPTGSYYYNKAGSCPISPTRPSRSLQNTRPRSPLSLSAGRCATSTASSTSSNFGDLRRAASRSVELSGLTRMPGVSCTPGLASLQPEITAQAERTRPQTRRPFRQCPGTRQASKHVPFRF
jgi:hypothetical protein